MYAKIYVFTRLYFISLPLRFCDIMYMTDSSVVQSV